MKTSADFVRLITPQSINISWEGKNRIITADNLQYSEILNCIKEERWNELEGLLDLAAVVVEYSNGLFRIDGGQVYVKQENGEFKVPTQLNERILFYMEKELPFDSLINFAMKLGQNPSYNSVHQLYQFMERHQFTLMNNGDFLAYKRVRENFTDWYTGKFDNSIGVIVKMPRQEISDNPNDGCSAGLHVANYHHASEFYSGANGILLEVQVNPKDVVSVPNDSNFEKIRVCEYKVLRICTEEFKELLYPESKEESEDYCEDCGFDADECGCDEICTECNEYLEDCGCEF